MVEFEWVPTICEGSLSQWQELPAIKQHLVWEGWKYPTMICGAESGTNYHGIKGSLGSQDTFFFILVHFFFNLYFCIVFQFQAHKTVLSCFFTDVCTWDKIPPLLENQSSDVLRALLHYLYTSCLPADISDETAKELQKLSQLNGKDIGHLSKLCTEYLEATAVKNSKLLIMFKNILCQIYFISSFPFVNC